SNIINPKIPIIFRTNQMTALFNWLTEDRVKNYVLEFNMFFNYFIYRTALYYINIGVETATPTSLDCCINRLTNNYQYKDTFGKISISTKTLSSNLKLHYRSILAEKNLFLTNNVFCSNYDKGKDTFYKDQSFVNHLLVGFV